MALVRFGEDADAAELPTDDLDACLPREVEKNGLRPPLAVVVGVVVGDEGMCIGEVGDGGAVGNATESS